MAEPNQSAIDIIATFEQALTQRGTLDSHCEEIARRVWPGYAGSFQNRGIVRIEGEKRTDDMVDSTAAQALARFGAAMESMLTPRNSIWQRVVPSDRGLMRNRLVRMWFDDVTDILFKYRQKPSANFQGQQHECYLSLGAFGTGCKFIDRLRCRGIVRPAGCATRPSTLPRFSSSRITRASSTPYSGSST
jgi:hypothetical protein